MARYFATGGTIHKKAFLSNSRVKWGCLGEPVEKPTYTWEFNEAAGEFLGDNDFLMSYFTSTSNTGDEVEISLSEYRDFDFTENQWDQWGEDIFASWGIDYFENCVFFTLNNGAFCIGILEVQEGYLFETGYNIWYEENYTPSKVRIYMCLTDDGYGITAGMDFSDYGELENYLQNSANFALILSATYNSSTRVWSVDNGV